MRRGTGAIVGGLALAGCGEEPARRVLRADISGPARVRVESSAADSVAAAAMRAAAPPPVPRVRADMASLVLHGASESPVDSASWQAPVAARATAAGWVVVRLVARPHHVQRLPNEVPVAVDSLTPAVGGIVLLPGRSLQPITRAQLERCDAACLHRLRGGEAREPARLARR